MNNNGLGRGLSAFFDTEEISDSINTSDNVDSSKYEIDGRKCSIQTININLIDENPYQPRQIFSDDSVISLSESIKKHGLLQPILIQNSNNGRYTLIAGERRLRASKLAQTQSIPCILCDKEYSDEQLLEIAILENIQRENLDIIEEAEAYKKLIDQFGHTQEEIANTIGKSRSHIANVLRLNTLPVFIKNMLHEKKITFGHARALIGIHNAEELAMKIVSEDLSVRQVENIISNRKIKVQNSSEEYIERSESDELKHLVSKLLGMGVKVKLKGNSGSIEIFFKNSNELDSFLGKINS